MMLSDLIELPMRRAIFIAVLLLPAISGLAVGASPLPSSNLLARAQATAAPKRKHVLVVFHASWCSWCNRLETVMKRPAVEEILDRHFVTQWLTILERPTKKDLENPGAFELYNKWTEGAQVGLPFYVVLDNDGNVRSSSIRPVTSGGKLENIGYPGTAEEIQAFVALLKDGAPNLTQAEINTLTQELNAAKPMPSTH